MARAAANPSLAQNRSRLFHHTSARRRQEQRVPDLGAQQTAELTAGMASGERNAVETFYRRYFDLLYAEARRATRRDEAFCLDVVQEGVLRIIRSVRRVDSEAQLATWLRLVIRTTALDLLRGETRRQRRQAVAVPIGFREEHFGRAPSDSDEQQITWLRRQIQSFDPQLIEIIDLRFHGRWTLARIAGKLGLSVGTIDGRLRRALRALRNRAREELDE